MTKRTKRAIIWSITGILVAIAAVAAYYFIAIYNQVDKFQKKGEDSPFYNVQPVETKKEAEPPKWEGTEQVNILLMGVDARGLKKGEVPRSDTMLVASIDPVKKKAYLFSIMRDTYIKIPGYGSDRINAAITHGPNKAMETVSELLGIPIQYYVYTDFQGFIELVDAIGGVDFYVEKDMRYTSKADNHEYDIDLKKGQQHLDGNSALQYVRFRHDALSDYSRTERQRNFLKAVAEKMISTTSIMKLPSILEKVNPYIDTNLTVNDMWKLATVAYDSKMAGSEQIPPMKLVVEKNVGGSEVIGIRSDDELKQFVQDVFNAPDEPEQDTDSDNSPAGAAGTDKSTSTGAGTGTGTSRSTDAGSGSPPAADTFRN
ncbi:LCP family protein [Paenibacillus woosongensis]|uniref:LytR family transcriptional regulator n=1 Tax=Paenibacillus woosongensis TaxID=307580 RepID=A0A7X2Z2T8_9BACL|nr:LCP family protein [Paenibacillus woosongensis]MUG46562.1 LytR family transcriptional regulator [Paenibacillus woosongensis]